MDKRARRPRSQDVTPRATPWVGEWPARACRSCRRFAGLRPVAGKMPALPGHHSQPWVGEWPARACRSCRRFAGLRPVAGKMPALPGHSQGHALGGGVTGSGVSFLSALRGPSARCGQDARAPRTSLPGHALGGGVAGSGVSFLSALRGPSARCGQDRAGRHSQGHALGGMAARACRSCRRFAGLRPVAGKGAPRTSLPGPCLGWGSGRLGRVVLVGASRAFGPLRARCPRSQGHRSQGRASAFCGAGSEQVSEPDRGLVARQVARTCSVGSVGPGQLEARLVSDHHDCTYCLRRWRRSCSPRMLA